MRAMRMEVGKSAVRYPEKMARGLPYQPGCQICCVSLTVQHWSFDTFS